MFASELYFNIAKQLAPIEPHRLIMVTGNIYDLSALLGFLQQQLYHLILCLWPVYLTLHGPKINNIPQQINGVGFGLLQKMQQIFSLTVFTAQMNIRQEDGIAI